MKKVAFLLLSISFFVSNYAQEANSRDITVSLLTSCPTTKEVYTAFGHTAIRVQVPKEGIDIVFNYGIFAFEDGFLYKFVKGETDYRLEITSFVDAVDEARYEKNVFMYEQVLNLTQAEKEKIFSSLLENSKQENKYYRYNFFFDNCATRAMKQVEKAVDGTILYPVFNNKYTFRDLIYLKLADMPWYSFGIDLCLGSETDRRITDKELLFLPEELMKSYAQSSILHNGEIRPLVKETLIDNSPQSETVKKDLPFFTPLYVFWFFFFLIAVHTVFYNYRKKKDLWIDVTLFAIYGLLGCLLFFLAFISVHPCTNPNYNLLWTNPLQLIFAVVVFFRKWEKPLVIYQMINALSVTAALVGRYILPQHFNAAFLPLMLVILLRSCNYIFHHRNKKKHNNFAFLKEKR